MPSNKTERVDVRFTAINCTMDEVGKLIDRLGYAAKQFHDFDKGTAPVEITIHADRNRAILSKRITKQEEKANVRKA